jgi:hypothetical protein
VFVIALALSAYAFADAGRYLTKEDHELGLGP